MSSAPRLFLAAELPFSLRSALSPLLRKLARLDPELRPARADGLHVTLRFLGRVEAVAEASIHALAGRVASEAEPFVLSLEGMGTFPGKSRPRVLWAGVGEGRPELSRLAAALGAGLAAEACQRAPSPFRAHCTLARLPESLGPRSAQALAEFCDRGLGPPPLRATIDFLALLESVPVSLGPNRYPRRARWRLGGPEPAHHSKGRPYH
ncbi:MAG TPA: RNA 2',3'-cyclic phosphodiesterase [Candidatus Saccharimonadales bacterium]|nr:RNA 2',3'-cyclic phosphodiesterase [Candidatus Saccharimonadales bacterium]